jgi:hypothetical protein
MSLQGRVGRWLFLVSLSQLISQGVTGQSPNFNQRDDKYRVLGLKRAKETYEVAKAEFDRQKELFDRKLISAVELDRARNYFADAEVNYQQSLLAVIFEQQYVSVTSAVKYYDGKGQRRVRITLSNMSSGSAEAQKLVHLDDPIFRSLQPDIINNVYVSLLNDGRAIISQPYEAKISELKFGEPQTIDFAILEDLDAVTVGVIYGSGTERTMKIYLQKDATVNKVAVQSEQFSQEVELGKTATFDLNLELYSGRANTFGLEVVGLPPEISRLFRDGSSQARLSQVRFSEATRSKKAALEVSLPDRPTGTVVIDKTISFFVVVIPTDKLDAVRNSADREWTAEELQKLDVGFVRLDLVPRGKGRLLVKATQLYLAIEDDAQATVSLDLVNEGSDRLDNVALQLDLPLNWTKQIDPSAVPSIAVGTDAVVKLTITPPDDIAPGKYDVRVRSSAMSNGQPVIGEDKTITIEILPGSNVLGTILLVLVIVGLVAGLVVFGIRLSKK